VNSTFVNTCSSTFLSALLFIFSSYSQNSVFVTAKDRWQGVRVTAFAFSQLCIDLIFAFIWADRLYIHGEHKRTLQFQNDAENKFGVVRTYTHSSRQKSQSFVSNDLGDCCCCEPLVLKMATLQQGSWCVLKLAKTESVTAVQCAYFHTVSCGTTQASIHLCLVQEIQAERVQLQRQESWLVICVCCNCGSLLWCGHF
jgi:hypothetical protein